MPYLLASLSFSAIVAASLVIDPASLAGSSVDARRAEPASLPMPNRALKADRLPPGDGSTRVKTISIRPVPAEDRVEVSQVLFECEGVVSPLADPALSRRVRACAT